MKHNFFLLLKYLLLQKRKNNNDHRLCETMIILVTHKAKI